MTRPQTIEKISGSPDLQEKVPVRMENPLSGAGHDETEVWSKSEIGDIHFSSYIPETYDGTRPYALFITLSGWEGLYF